MCCALLPLLSTPIWSRTLDADIATSTPFVDQDCVDGTVVTRYGSEPTPDHPFFRLYMSSRFCSYPTRTRDDRSVTMRSDFYGLREWQASPMYRDCLGEAGIKDELMCCLPLQRSRTRRVIFHRTSAVGFSERDRLLLALLRPHLADGLRAVAMPTQPQLTIRQWELMRLVAAGHSNSEIARQLYLSAHTVRKHLENIYARLEVNTRTAAVATAFPSGVE
jgi:DNA-binding CsgD family transcriptional regulator